MSDPSGGRPPADGGRDPVDGADAAGGGAAAGDAGDPPTRSELTHLDERGHARMVAVQAKDATTRTAVANARVRMSRATAERLADGSLPKGDALPVARIAGIQAAKRTPELIPLCHQVALTSVEVEVAVDVAAGLAEVVATATAVDRTGVEMEAMTAVSVAALTLYDLLKAVQRDVVITDVRLRHKSGGRSGDIELP